MSPFFYIIYMLFIGLICVAFERWLVASGRYRSSAAASLLSFICLGGGLHALAVTLIFPWLTGEDSGISSDGSLLTLLFFLSGIWGSAILEARARKNKSVASRSMK